MNGVANDHLAKGVAAQAVARPPSDQLRVLIELLERPGGASFEELMIATGWEAAWVRGAIFGALRNRRRLGVLSQRTKAGRLYRIATE